MSAESIVLTVVITRALAAYEFCKAEQVGHFLVDIDPGFIVEALLQGAEHHVLALLQIGWRCSPPPTAG